MSSNLSVIQGSNCTTKLKKLEHTENVLKKSELWGRTYLESIAEGINSNNTNKVEDLPQETLKKIGFAGIKFMGTLRNLKRCDTECLDKKHKYIKNNQNMFSMMEFVLQILGSMTLKNFVNTFPITKDYDGHKWGSKDYFFTMDVLSNMDWDKPIGKENISDLIWDYQNEDLREAYVEYMCIVSELFREKTGKGIAEQFCDDIGIPTYTINKETGIIRDNQTGQTTKLKSRSNLQIVK